MSHTQNQEASEKTEAFCAFFLMWRDLSAGSTDIHYSDTVLNTLYLS